MKKYIGKKWGQLSQCQQQELMRTISGTIDGRDCSNVDDGECIVDFKNGISVVGYVVCHNADEGDYDICIDDDSILYDPEQGTIVENKKFKDLITLKDAANMFNKEESTLRRNISNGFFKEWQDCIKFGTTWVFDINALERKYGK